jgi:hypothetical protein
VLVRAWSEIDHSTMWKSRFDSSDLAKMRLRENERHTCRHFR